MRHAFRVIGCIAALTVTGPFAAAETEPDLSLPEELEDITEATREAIRRFNQIIAPMLREFGAAIDDLPEYEAPEIAPNGDIIIRRKRPDPPPAQTAPPLDPDAPIDL